MKPQVDLFSFVFWRKLKTPKRHFEINWPLVMSKKVGDFVKFCSLLRIYELYKTEAAIDMDIAWPIWQFFTKRFGRGKMFFFLATLQILFLSQNLYPARIRIDWVNSLIGYLSTLAVIIYIVENENKDHKNIEQLHRNVIPGNQIQGP